jgi:hypothetical protein
MGFEVWIPPHCSFFSRFVRGVSIPSQHPCVGRPFETCHGANNKHLSLLLCPVADSFPASLGALAMAFFCVDSVSSKVLMCWGGGNVWEDCSFWTLSRDRPTIVGDMLLWTFKACTSTLKKARTGLGRQELWLSTWSIRCTRDSHSVAIPNPGQGLSFALMCGGCVGGSCSCGFGGHSMTSKCAPPIRLWLVTGDRKHRKESGARRNMELSQ